MDVFLMSLTLCNLPCFLRAPTLAHLGSAAKYLLLAVLALGLIELSVFCHLYEEGTRILMLLLACTTRVRKGQLTPLILSSLNMSVLHLQRAA